MLSESVPKLFFENIVKFRKSRVKQLGHEILFLNDYYYRVKHLDEGILKLLLEKTGQYLARKNKDKNSNLTVAK